MSDDILPVGVKEDRRVNTHEALKEYVDQQFDEVHARLTRFFRVVSVTGILVVVVICWLFIRQGDTTDSIQDQRFNSLVTLCEQQNTRHDATVERAKKRFPPEDAADRIFLIDALQPYVKDCTADAKRRVKGR